ncbi:hypothetical protein H2200_008580 [Cladophialophora chaetospira]|uniref:AB hydrolase-1 domain-containing protein n=1 Tax=Cladophialophora chaetospira TaxID=386627 RepID=A0AA38X4A2_9EURO|nr:hypothetical protein H2200_008580 [Cladophialophora chaetospira]
MTDSEQSALADISRIINLPHGINAYTAGHGPPVVLLPGWPQTADAYSEVFESLSKRHQVWAIDPPGLGDSAPSKVGYDTQNISKLLDESLSSTISAPYHLVGHDVGAWIAYAWAAQFPSSIKSLTVLDSAIPGKAPPLSFPLPDETNLKMWQFSFNRLPDLPEALTQGRERVLLDWLFDHKATHPERITEAKRTRYAQCYSRSNAMSQGFAYYRAVTVSAQQNMKFSKTKSSMPVLAIGGSSGIGHSLRISMESLADNVTGGEIEDCGHFVTEEQPEEVSRRLLEFFKNVDSSVTSGP